MEADRMAPSRNLDLQLKNAELPVKNTIESSKSLRVFKESMIKDGVSSDKVNSIKEHYQKKMDSYRSSGFITQTYHAIVDFFTGQKGDYLARQELKRSAVDVLAGGTVVLPKHLLTKEERDVFIANVEKYKNDEIEELKDLEYEPCVCLEGEDGNEEEVKLSDRNEKELVEYVNILEESFLLEPDMLKNNIEEFNNICELIGMVKAYLAVRR